VFRVRILSGVASPQAGPLLRPPRRGPLSIILGEFQDLAFRMRILSGVASPQAGCLLCPPRCGCDTLLMKLLVKRLAIPLSNQKTVAKWLVIAIRLGESNTLAKSLVMAQASRLREQPLATLPAPDGCAAPCRGAARSVSFCV